MLFLRDCGDTEIGGFGLSAPDDLLLVVDILPVKQRCTPVTVAFDDKAVADLFDDLVDQGIPPERFGRIWIHTHPGECPLPSITDEATFRRAFGGADWSVMAIVARNDAAYARVAFHIGPGGSLGIPVAIDYRHPFEASDCQAWKQAYEQTVTVETRSIATHRVGRDGQSLLTLPATDDPWDWDPYHDEYTDAGSF